MKLNDRIIADTIGDIYYDLPNGNTIKLGTFEINSEFNHVKIELGDICKLEYEYRSPEMIKDCIGITPYMYWFKSQYVCDRYHGTYSRDDAWITKLFEEVTPFTDDINCRLEEFFRIAFDRVQKMA